MGTPRDQALLNGPSRVAVLSSWTMLASGVVMLIGFLETLPAAVWILLDVALPLSIVAWAVAVYRDARSSEASLGSAVRRALRLTWRAAWELLP